MAESRAIAYKQKLDALVRDAKAIPPEAQKRIGALLADLNREVLAALAKANPASYNATQLKALKAEIERAAQTFARDAASSVSQMEQDVYRKVAIGTDQAVAAGTGSLVVQPLIDQKSLAIVQGYTADLITGLSHEASTKINAAIQRAYMGGSTLPELVKQVGSALPNGNATGIFDSISTRAVDIAINETLRVHSLAGQARMEDLVTRHPELEKEWKHIPATLMPRPLHIIADGQKRKISEPYDIAGEALMYPRDPAGSPGNTINCHCLSRPSLPASVLKPSDNERALLRSAGISVSTR